MQQLAKGILCLACCFVASIGATDVVAYERSDFPYKERIFTSSYSGRYSSQAEVTKTDVVITGDKITIDQPLLTNGGDVVIAGNSVVIEAPIDTRIYLDHSAYLQRNGNCPTPLDMLVNLPNATAAFRDYYTKAWLWNDARKWWELSSASTYPEMPQGDTPDYCAGAILPGRDAPSGATLDLDNLRSGSITIVAPSVTFCDECVGREELEYDPATIPNYPPRSASDDGSPHFPECRAFGDMRQKKGSLAWHLVHVIEIPFALSRIRTGNMLVTSGLDAGRGGAGQTDDCIYPGNSRFRCYIDVPGGEAGSEGPQGGAGHIKLALVNQFSNDPDFQPFEYYEERSAYQAGERIDYHLATSGFDRLNAFPNRCSFRQKALPKKDHGPHPGLDGEFDVIHTDAAGALDLLGATLLELDARVERDVGAILAKGSPALTAMKPSEHLTKYLLDIVLRMQREVVDSLLTTPNAAPPSVEPLLSGLPYYRYGQGLLPQQQLLLSRISNLSRVQVTTPGNGFEIAAAYLMNGGGIFNLTGQDVMAQMAAVEISSELNIIQQRLAEISNDLGSLRIDLQEYFAAQRSSELEATVTRLRDQVTAIENAIEKQRTDPGLVAFAQEYAAIAELISNGVIKPFDAKGIKGASGDVLKAAKEAYVRITQFGKKDHTLHQTAEELRKQAMVAAEAALRFARYVEAERDAILEARVGRLRDIVDAKSRYTQKQIARAVLFDEALRQVLVHYLVGKSEDQWRSNLAALNQLTELSQPGQITLTLPDRNIGCADADITPEAKLPALEVFVKCISVAQRRSEVSVYVADDGLVGRIPIARLAPNMLPAVLQTFGIFRGRMYQFADRQ